MIVYKVIGWAGTRPKTRKMRTSDKSKRWYDKFYKRRGANSYWWKEVDDNDNRIQ